MIRICHIKRHLKQDFTIKLFDSMHRNMSNYGTIKQFLSSDVIVCDNLNQTRTSYISLLDTNMHKLYFFKRRKTKSSSQIPEQCAKPMSYDSIDNDSFKCKNFS